MTLEQVKRILLVDDDPAGAELTVAAIATIDPEVSVDVVVDGEEALDYVFRRGSFSQRDDPEPTAVLLDLKMPKIDGHEVLRQIRAHAATRNLTVVVLTSSDQARDRTLSRELGSDDYLVKPSTMVELIDKLSHCERLHLSAP